MMCLGRKLVKAGKGGWEHEKEPSWHLLQTRGGIAGAETGQCQDWLA